MEVIYTPSVCKTTTDVTTGETVLGAFSGTVTVAVPTFDQRYEYMEQCGFESDDDGRVNTGELRKPRTIRKIVAISRAHYKAVAITRTTDGRVFNSFDDLATSPDCDLILMDVGIKILTGQIATVGNG